MTIDSRVGPDRDGVANLLVRATEHHDDGDHAKQQSEAACEGLVVVPSRFARPAPAGSGSRGR